MNTISQDHRSTLETSELVWDLNRDGTATAGRVALPAGDTCDWTPTRLLATAAGASLLTTFVGLAAEARLPLLGYVAQHRVTLDDHHILQLNVVPCISVPSDVAAARARDLWNRTMETAPVLQVLRCAVVSEPRIVVLGDAAPMDPEC